VAWARVLGLQCRAGGALVHLSKSRTRWWLVASGFLATCTSLHDLMEKDDFDVTTWVCVCGLVIGVPCQWGPPVDPVWCLRVGTHRCFVRASGQSFRSSSWIRHVALLDAVDAPIVAAWMSDWKALARMSSHAVRGPVGALGRPYYDPGLSWSLDDS
jgi:hypothetical protein